jgi:uncharacterized damage-inducible protein DinB
MTNPLDFILIGWADFQQNMVEAITPLTEDQLRLQAAPHLRTVGNLAAHIVAVRVGWFYEGLREGELSVRRYLTWNATTPTTAAELVLGLCDSWRLIDTAVRRWTEDDIAEAVPSLGQGKTYLLPRRYVTWHVLEHDLHHGGELFYTLGIHQIPTPEIGSTVGHILER